MPRTPLTPREVLSFWTPLAATWLMMAAEGPFLAAVIARLPEPKHNLAAYGIAFSIALLMEAPVIMIMGATTALVSGPESFQKMRRFTYSLSAGLTICMAVLLVPGVFRAVVRGWIGLPPEVGNLIYPALLLLLPWPGAIGYRRLYQGVLIRAGRTRRVGYGTGIRLATLALTALALLSSGLPGASVGAAALSGGVLVEAVVTRLMVRSALVRLSAGNRDPTGAATTYRSILAFYGPLALSTLLTLAVHPTVAFLLARSRSPVESLAVYPVVRSLVFLFSCLGLSYQEVGIALLARDRRGYPAVRTFAVLLAAAATGVLALIAFSPAADLWYREVSGLAPDLAAFATWPTRILTPVPALTVFLSLQRSLFLNARRTGAVTWATLVEVGAVGTVLALSIGALDLVGVTGAALALLGGRMLGNAYLFSRRQGGASKACDDP